MPTQIHITPKERKEHDVSLFDLWAIGVGAVIVALFFGWELVLRGGFLGSVCSILLSALLYYLLTLSIGEMTLAFHIPETSGSFHFALVGMHSNYWALMVATSEFIKVIANSGIIFAAIGKYLFDLLPGDTPSYFYPVFWFITIAILTFINADSLNSTLSFQKFCTTLAMCILIIFIIAAPFKMNFEKWAIDEGSWWGHSTYDLITCFGFGIWFFIGFEQMPLAVANTKEPEKILPKAFAVVFWTLFIFDFLIFILNVSLSPGLDSLEDESAPLLEGFKAIFGANSVIVKILSGFIVFGLICSAHSFIYYNGEVLQVMFKEFFPSILNLPFVQKVNRIRYHGEEDINLETEDTGKDDEDEMDVHHIRFSLIIANILAFFLMILLFQFESDEKIGYLLIGTVVISALTSYAIQFVSYIYISTHLPDLERPFRSPAGKIGAYIGLIICIFLQVCMILTAVNKRLYLVAILFNYILYVLITIYYLVIGIHKETQPEHQKVRATYRKLNLQNSLKSNEALHLLDDDENNY